MWFHSALQIMVGADHRMMAYLSRSINYPVTCFLFLETAVVTDPVVQFTPLVFTAGYAEDFITPVPQGYFTGTFRAITVCINRFQEPYAVLEAEGLIG